MDDTLPPFDDAGLLPAGDYPLTLTQLRASYLVTGTGVVSATWDSAWRGHLADNLEIMATQLWQVGIEKIFIDGSFAEAKDHPNDVDGYFECDLKFFASGHLERALNALDPQHVWTWRLGSRRLDATSGKAQLPMWHHYRVELYPHFNQPSGIRDEFGNQQTFPAAFRRTRAGHQPKGIVELPSPGSRGEV